VQHADIIGERYRLDRKIGQGGTGSIWLAHDDRLDRQVAIKFLFAHSPQHQERLARRVALEAKIAASIQHRNVVQIFDFGTHESNIPYIVMEALSGFSLGEAFDDNQSFSLDVMIHIMSEVLRGLATVHDAGIVHRDLKPENIFLVKERGDKLSPKLLDFGISRSLEPDTRRSAVTTTEGLILGTPQYMSPEQARGLGNIDKRTDIYSVGIILFEALAGFVPFDSENMGDLLIKVIRGKPPPLHHIAPQLGEALCSVVDKALARNREHRYSDAAEMHEALLAAVLHVPTALERDRPMFPPPAIQSRSQSKRSGFESEFNLQAQEPSDPPPSEPAAARGLETVGDRGPRNRRRSDEQATVAADAASASTPQNVERERNRATVSASPKRAAIQRWLPLGLGVVAVLSIALSISLALRNRGASRSESGFIVVQASGQNAAPQAAPSHPAVETGPQPPQPVEASARDSAEPRVKKPAASKARRAPRGGPDDAMQLKAEEVAQAFSRQKARVISCLDDHPDDMESAPQLTVRVTVNVSGKVTEAKLLPDSITTRPVGSCVAVAVQSMGFPGQTQPTTYRIPLLWRRK
jgi:serine/threonine protein kinase